MTAIPEIAGLALLVRGLAAATFVGGVIALMERCSPFIGGIVLALPIVTAPAYLFLLLQHDAGFIAVAAQGSLGTIGAVLLFIAAVIALVRRLPMPAVLACALGIWFAVGLLIRLLPPHLLTSLAVMAIAGLLAWLGGRRVPLTAPAARGRSPLSEIVLRGAMAGGLVIGVSLLADLFGPRIAGIFASFPVALLAVCWFLPRRLDAAGIRAAMRATQIGMVSHIPFFCCLILLGPAFAAQGLPRFAAFGLGLVGSLLVALTLATLRRRQMKRVNGA
ncbi:MAG: hypothetical protein ACK4FK_03050 [Ferrovibrio sp.]|jgi:uncharacterized membrane protein (GlpM family)|uniref:hypothetical protein n=1 Tax=Ferrovibrio sp. TaxID=1917215 RepID=UPI00391DE52F